jgi:endonuclease G, mitochondrial
LDNSHDLVHDWGGGTVQIPLEFWKVIVVSEDDGSEYGALRTYGFMLEQASTIKKNGLEAFEAGVFETYQRSLQEISKATGVVFDKVLLQADVLVGVAAEPAAKRRIKEAKDIRHATRHVAQ